MGSEFAGGFLAHLPWLHRSIPWVPCSNAWLDRTLALLVFAWPCLLLCFQKERGRALHPPQLCSTRTPAWASSPRSHRSNDCCKRRTPDGHTVSCVTCSPDGTLAACAAGKTVHLFELTAEDVEASRWAVGGSGWWQLRMWRHPGGRGSGRGWVGCSSIGLGSGGVGWPKGSC